MAVPGQKVTCGHRGKPSYQAPVEAGKTRVFFFDAGFLKREVDRFLEFAWDFKLFRTWDLRFVFGQILSVLAFFFWCVFFAETIALYFFCKNRSLFSCCLSGEIRDFFFFIYKVGFWDSFSANLEISGLCSNPSSFLNWMMNDQPEIGPVGVAELVSV